MNDQIFHGKCIGGILDGQTITSKSPYFKCLDRQIEPEYDINLGRKPVDQIIPIVMYRFNANGNWVLV